MSGTVLVLTHEFDPTADLVVEELNRRGLPLLRCDPGQFPTELTISAELDAADWSGRLTVNGRTLSLDAVAGVYYRRPTGFRFADALSGEERRWAATQARLGFGGVLATLDRWLNHPHAMGFAEYKPVQLQQARRCGLAVPRTLVTNDPAAARTFVSTLDRAVSKPFGANSFVDADGVHQIFAAPVAADDVTESVGATMHQFQAWVPKAYEVRLTVVDETMFAARIDAGSAAAHQDWRSDYRNLSYSAVDVPENVRCAVTALLRVLSLRFGALDFVVDHDGRWWFLELNPNGQWGWIEDEVGFPIASALADALVAA